MSGIYVFGIIIITFTALYPKEAREVKYNLSLLLRYTQCTFIIHPVLNLTMMVASLSLFLQVTFECTGFLMMLSITIIFWSYQYSVLLYVFIYLCIVL